MSMHSQMAEQLEARWQWEQPTLSGLKSTFLTMTSFVKAPDNKLAELKADKSLSEFGVRDRLRSWAGSGYVRELKATQKKMATRLECIKRERADLAKPKTDKSDVVGALLRQELRAHMRSLSIAELSTVLLGKNADPQFVVAALEAPSSLTGMDATIRTAAERAYIEANFAGKAQELVDETEATEHVATAGQAAVNALRVESGLVAHEFDQWMQLVPAAT